MDSHTLEVLTERIEAAERGLRAARRALLLGSVVVLLVVGGAVWWYLDPTLGRGEGPKTVEAQHFIVRDAQGAARAALELSEAGSVQLVFYQDPLPGDAWREHAGDGPFGFGVRSTSTGPQLLLNDHDGKRLQASPTDLTLASGVVLTSSGGEAQIGLRDSSGATFLLGANTLKQLLSKPAAPVHTPTRRRHAR